jgi:hypothetical protein
MTPHPDVVAAAAWLAAREATVAADQLEHELYGWYLRAERLPAQPGLPGPADVDLAAALDAAHAEATRFTGGWMATAAGAGGIAVARRDGVERPLGRAEYVVPARPGLPARAGDALAARAAWTYLDDDHAFWYTRRGAWPPAGADRLARTYVAVAPTAEPVVVAALTGLLAAHPAVPYRLKAHLPAGLPAERTVRADSVVLYLGSGDAAALDGPLPAALAALADVVRPGRPRFTAELVPGVPGVGRAESSLHGESFGEARTRVLAAAWVALDGATRRDPDRAVAALVAALGRAGVDPARPHLLGEGEVAASRDTREATGAVP